MGAWLLAGRVGVAAGRGGLAAAVVVFMLCGFQVIWLNQPERLHDGLAGVGMLGIEQPAD